MKLKHSKSELKRKEQEMQKTAAQYTKDKGLMDRIEQEVTNLKVSTLHLHTHIPVLHSYVLFYQHLIFIVAQRCPIICALIYGFIADPVGSVGL